MFGVALNLVTTRKIVGATDGFLAPLPWANNRVQGVNDFDSNPGAGLTDMFLQPINLGWHTPRADVMAAYGLYLPTGRYQDGLTTTPAWACGRRRCFWAQPSS